jgi:hypothetical protein
MISMKKLSLKVKFMCGSVLLILVLSVLTSCAWWQKHEPSFDCAAIASIEDAPQLISIIETCIGISVNQAAVLPCIEGAAASKWTSDVIKCFTAAAQGKAKCPAYDTAKMASKQASKPAP